MLKNTSLNETKCDKKNVKFNWLIARIHVVGLFSYFFNESMVSIMGRCFVETNFYVQLFEKFRLDVSNIALDLIVRSCSLNQY